MRISIGIGCWFDDWDLGYGKRYGKVGIRWGFAMGGVMEKLGGIKKEGRMEWKMGIFG